MTAARSHANKIRKESLTRKAHADLFIEHRKSLLCVDGVKYFITSETSLRQRYGMKDFVYEVLRENEILSWRRQQPLTDSEIQAVVFHEYGNTIRVREYRCVYNRDPNRKLHSFAYAASGQILHRSGLYELSELPDLLKTHHDNDDRLSQKNPPPPPKMLTPTIRNSAQRLGKAANAPKS